MKNFELMKRKYIVLLVILVLVFITWYGYSEYNRKNDDLTNKKPAYTIAATELIAAFEKDSSSANKKYTDQVIAVSGNVKSIDVDGNPIVIALGATGQMSSVQCSMDSTYTKKSKSIKEGDNLMIKGMCTGGRTEELFGTDVILNRCVLDNKK